MARKTSFVNFKGGVAKSTDSQFTASGLAELGYRVLLIDLDQQQNTTYTLMPDGILNIENRVLLQSLFLAQIQEKMNTFQKFKRL